MSYSTRVMLSYLSSISLDISSSSSSLYSYSYSYDDLSAKSSSVGGSVVSTYSSISEKTVSSSGSSRFPRREERRSLFVFLSTVALERKEAETYRTSSFFSISSSISGSTTSFSCPSFLWTLISLFLLFNIFLKEAG